MIFKKGDIMVFSVKFLLFRLLKVDIFLCFFLVLFFYVSVIRDVDFY